MERAAAALGLRLRRAWPRSPDHLLLDLVGDAGPVAGQWFAEPARAEAVAARTGPPCRAVPGTGLLVQPAGADRHLPALAGLLAEPGTVLVSHRPERRAVVRSADGSTHTKVVRPDRAQATADAAREARRLGVTVPTVLDVDASRGTVTTATLPGRPLHDLLADPLVPPGRLVAAARGLGRALAGLHHSAPPAGASAHGPAAELGVTARWVDLATAHGVVSPDTAAALAAGTAELAARARLLPPAPRAVPLHRDLHDKQVLVEDESVGLLDFDLVAAGDPALDLANLLTHLELRTAQGLVTPALAAACAQAVVDAYAPAAATVAALPVYGLAARLRLVAVYAFRPTGARASLSLLP